MADVDDIIGQCMECPVVWGESDCCMALANVHVCLGLPDPAAGFRGRYWDRDSARFVMQGDIDQFIPRLAQRMGWVEGFGDPAIPDVGLVRTTRGWSAALWRGNSWVIKTGTGVGVTPEVSRFWRVQPCA